MPQVTVRFKRTTGNTLPNSLSRGELVYVEGLKALFIGSGDDVNPILVADGSIIEHDNNGNPTAFKLKRNDTTNFKLTTPNDVTENYTLTLPETLPTAPDGKVPVLVDTDGTITYENPSFGNLFDITNVGGADVTLEDNDTLIYQSGIWQTVPPSTVSDMMGLTDDDDVEYRNVTVTGNLDVNGAVTSDETPTIVVQDKLVTMGLGDMYTRSATMTNGRVDLGPVVGLPDASSVFVDSTISQIPAGNYTVYQTSSSSDGSEVYNYTDPDTGLQYTVNIFGSQTHGADWDAVTSFTFNISSDISADVLVVGGGSGDNDGSFSGYHNPEGGNAGEFKYFRNIQIPAGTYDINVGHGSRGGYSNASTAGANAGSSSMIKTADVIGTFDYSITATGGLGVGHGSTINSAGGDGARTIGTSGAYQNQNIWNGIGGWGYQEGDVVPNNGPSVTKILVEDAFVNDPNVHPELDPYDYDVHITRTHAKEELRYGGTVAPHPYQSNLWSNNGPLGNYHPYLTEGGDIVDDNTPALSIIVVTGTKFEILGMNASFSGGGYGSASGGGYVAHNTWYRNGERAVGRKQDPNHKAGGGPPAWNNERGGVGTVMIRYISPGTTGGVPDGKAFFVPGSTDTIEDEFNLTISDKPLTDSSISGGGIAVLGSSEKKVTWKQGANTDPDSWNFEGGDLRVDSNETENTAVYLNNTDKVFEVDVLKQIVDENPTSEQILRTDAEQLHNYTAGMTHIRVGRIDTSFSLEDEELEGDVFDFGSF